MGNIAIDRQEDDLELEPGQDDESTEAVSSTDDVDDESKSGDDDQEVQIVYSGDDGSQPDQERINRGVRKRVNKLNDRNKASQLQASEANQALTKSEQENLLLREVIRHNSEPDVPTLPDPNDYDDGVTDPKYVKAHNEHMSRIVQAEVQRQTPAQRKAPVDNSYLERHQEQHYSRVDNLKIKDYQEVEDVAVDIIGHHAVNELIQSSENAHLILYHLGKFPDKARDIADLLDAGEPVKAMMKVGALEVKLSAKKVKVNQVPDPDTPLVGGKPAKKGKRGPPGAIYS